MQNKCNGSEQSHTPAQFTSSMKSTPGTISALPSSRHSATLPSICSRTCCRRWSGQAEHNEC